MTANDYPIVLAHGIARFDFLVRRFAEELGRIGLSFDPAANELNYFRGIARHLRNHGFDVYQSTVSFAAGVERRAADLKTEVERALALRPGQPKVHIIAHSMGGLDARRMIVKLGMADRVASLTTIGTPHRGTSFADWGIANDGDALIAGLGGIIDISGFADLTTDACRRFNEEAEAAEAANEVFYQTFAASEEETKIFPPLRGSWRIIFPREGDNDGLVPRTSQAWTDTLAGADGRRKTVRQRGFPVSADHLNEVGWWDVGQFGFDDFFRLDFLNAVAAYETAIRNVYLEIARELIELPPDG